MKNNILLNPFAILSDKRQTIIGIISLIIGIALIYIFQIQIEIIGLHIAENLKLQNASINQLIIVCLLTLAFFCIGKIINKKTRIIDILNTILLAFIPIYISTFINFNGYMDEQNNKIYEAFINNNVNEIKLPFLFLVISVFMILMIVYYFYLLFIGFKTATNSKKAWHYVLFFATLIIIDLLTSYIINYI